MRFQHYSPNPALRHLLQGYLEADCRNTVKQSMYPLFPNGLSGIFFNFGNPGKLILEKEYTTFPVSIFGQIDQHFSAADAPGFYSLGVLFKPTILSKFLRVDMGEFTNRAFDGTLIRGELAGLYQCLGNTTEVPEKIRLLDDYFLKNLLSNSCADSLSDHAVQLIYTKEGITIEELATRLNVSQRHLEIQFKKAVGLSPKSYALIQRFLRTAQRLKDEYVPGQRLNFGDAYYDQMHLIKDFKRYTGYTPVRYLNEDLEMGKSYLIG